MQKLEGQWQTVPSANELDGGRAGRIGVPERREKERGEGGDMSVLTNGGCEPTHGRRHSGEAECAGKEGDHQKNGGNRLQSRGCHLNWCNRLERAT